MKEETTHTFQAFKSLPKAKHWKVALDQAWQQLATLTPSSIVEELEIIWGVKLGLEEGELGEER